MAPHGPSTPAGAKQGGRGRKPPENRSYQTPIYAAQSAALLAIAAVWLQPSDTDPAFRTLTTAEPLPAGHYVRVVFDPGVDDAGVASLLEPTDLTVVAGPSARGVVTLRFPDDTGGNERDAIIRQMREDGRVLFAEAVDSGG